MSIAASGAPEQAGSTPHVRTTLFHPSRQRLSFLKIIDTQAAQLFFNAGVTSPVESVRCPYRHLQPEHVTKCGLYQPAALIKTPSGPTFVIVPTGISGGSCPPSPEVTCVADSQSAINRKTFQFQNIAVFTGQNRFCTRVLDDNRNAEFISACEQDTSRTIADFGHADRQVPDQTSRHTAADIVACANR